MHLLAEAPIGNALIRMHQLIGQHELILIFTINIHNVFNCYNNYNYRGNILKIDFSCMTIL